MTEVEKGKRSKLSHAVREQILELIKTGELRPGDALPSERELMRSLGIGRPAIREALQALQTQELVEIRHGGRARVALPSMARVGDRMAETMRHLLAHSPASLEHLKEARATFEMEMARIAARTGSGSDIQRLRSVLRSQREALSEPARFRELDGHFHREVAAVSGNPIFTALAEAIFRWLSDFHVDLVQAPGLEQLTLEEHEAILAAIEARDAGRAAKAMGDHLNRANRLYHAAHLRLPDLAEG
jgi:DNA-binding FadR family transcriptional regulator